MDVAFCSYMEEGPVVFGVKLWRVVRVEVKPLKDFEFLPVTSGMPTSALLPLSPGATTTELVLITGTFGVTPDAPLPVISGTVFEIDSVITGIP